MKKIVLALICIVTTISCHAAKLTIVAPIYAGDTCSMFYANRVHPVILNAAGKAVIEITPPMDYCILSFGNSNPRVTFYTGQKDLTIKIDDQKMPTFIGAYSAESIFMDTVNYPTFSNKPVVETKEQYRKRIQNYHDSLEKVLVNSGIKDKRFLKLQRVKFDMMCEALISMHDTIKAEDERYQRLTTENTDYLNVSEYIYTLYGMPKELLDYRDRNIAQLPYEKNRKLFDYIIEKYKNKEILQCVLHRAAIDYLIDNGNDKYMDSIYRKYVYDPYFIADYTSLSDKWKELWIGQELRTLPVTNRLNEPLNMNQYRGKYVLIDIWATWCKPCVREQKLMLAMEAEFAGKPIAFLTISIDKFRKLWIEYLNQNSMKGDEHFNIKGENLISTIFAIRVIPRFILIGPDGKLLSANYYKPSTDKFKKTLLNLLD